MPIMLGVDKELENFLNSEYVDSNRTIIQALIRKLEGYSFENNDTVALMKLYAELLEFFDLTEQRPEMSIAYDKRGTIQISLGQRSTEQNKQWAINKTWTYLPSEIGVKQF